MTIPLHAGQAVHRDVCYIMKVKSLAANEQLHINAENPLFVVVLSGACPTHGRHAAAAGVASIRAARRRARVTAAGDFL